jgi:YD repeat-containing protein
MYARFKARLGQQCARWSGTVVVVAAALAVVSPVWGAVYNFAYDEVGRLTGVADDTGNVATYAYDAAGNITAIGRDNAAVPATGTYTIKLDPYGNSVGSLTFALYEVPADASGTIAIGGSPATLTMTVPGQNGKLTFSGASGQRVTLSTSQMSIGCHSVVVLNPDGSNLFNSGTSCGTMSVGLSALPASGSFTIKLDPFGNPMDALDDCCCCLVLPGFCCRDHEHLAAGAGPEFDVVA